ncbi:MAG: CooT family nickel-binding protein [Clostridia bacterium]|nr:CooT family nickel-binding protein [Clostridia bacterium]
MCLSTVYKNEKKPGNEVLTNVMLIECADGFVTLTDIMGREEKVKGAVASADLTGGCVIVKEAN